MVIQEEVGLLVITKNSYNTIIQVTVIVMITKLIEDGKRKAHQYWPDDTDGEESLGHVYELGGGIRVEHLSSSFQVLVVDVNSFCC